MTPISPYADLVEELRSQATRNIHPRAGMYRQFADQLEAIEAHDTEHAAIWRQRYEQAIGAEPPVDLRELTPEQLAARMTALRGHQAAAQQRERDLEAEILAVEMEIEKR